MNNATFFFAQPKNETVFSYAPNSKERILLEKELNKQYNECIEIPLIIGGKEIKTGNVAEVVMPTEHSHVLAKFHKADKEHVRAAIASALEARKKWEKVDWIDSTKTGLYQKAQHVRQERSRKHRKSPSS